MIIKDPDSDAGKEIHFLADTNGFADLPVYFTGHNSVEIRIYENDDKESTRTKTLSW